VIEARRSDSPSSVQPVTQSESRGREGPNTELGDDESRWAHVRGRDAGADGAFVYAVRTTGIYCRPSCGSRRPRRENAIFFDSPVEALRAGFRPCKRCLPDEPPPAARQSALVAELCEFIREGASTPTLAELAERTGLSPSHTRRLFEAVTGLSPRKYAEACRSQRLRESLLSAPTTTEAYFDAGYGSSARFYSGAAAALGMSPRAYRRGGVDTTLQFAVGDSSLGSFLVAATEKGVSALFLGDAPEPLVQELEQRFPNARLCAGDEHFEETVARAVHLIESIEAPSELPIDVLGTVFQHRVWRALRQIPSGETRSYAELAAAIGQPSAARAVARACATNPVALAIPCHRIVRRDGSLSGYRWGVERKRALLERERALRSHQRG
jgi:AraC family transcriptional regulator, regulatory protein of adaptative response / methylated-DNA-[protein]-cysteine methyltransferase